MGARAVRVDGEAGMDLATAIGIAGATCIAGAIAFRAVDDPVARRQVQRLADRQGLDVTADNGAQLIRYLAITGRWRAAGLVCGLTAYFLMGLTEQQFGISATHMIGGWLIGALVAEVQVSAGRVGRPATWGDLRRYLPLTLIRACAAAAVACLVFSPWTAVVVTAAVGAAAWWVLRRPAPVGAAPDVVAADDAIRSRSLHAIVAGGTTLMLYAAVGRLLALAVGGAGVDGTVAAAGLVALLFIAGGVAVLWIGWHLGTAPWTVLQPDVVSARTQPR